MEGGVGKGVVEGGREEGWYRGREGAGGKGGRGLGKREHKVET